MAQTVVDFGDAVRWMQDAGVYEFVLPFLLIFAIFYAILEKTKVLGKNQARINAVVAMVAGLLVVAQTNIVQTINMFLPRVSLAMVVILMGLMMIVLFAGKDYHGFGDLANGLAMIVVVVMLLLALSPEMGWNTARWITYADRQRLFSIGAFLAILALIYFIITSGKEKKPDRSNRTSWADILTDLGKLRDKPPG